MIFTIGMLYILAQGTAGSVFTWPFTFMVIGGLVAFLEFLLRVLRKPDNGKILTEDNNKILFEVAGIKTEINELRKNLEDLHKDAVDCNHSKSATDKDVVEIQTKIENFEKERKEIVERIGRLEIKIEKMSDLLISYFSSGGINR